MQEIEFEINREAVKWYFLAALLLTCAGFGLLFSPMILFILAALIAAHHNGGAIAILVFPFVACLVLLPVVFALWLCPQQANNLRYRLEDTTLRVDGSVFFLFRKSIPLERITDVALVQGPLLR